MPPFVASTQSTTSIQVYSPCRSTSATRDGRYGRYRGAAEVGRGAVPEVMSSASSTEVLPHRIPLAAQDLHHRLDSPLTLHPDSAPGPNRLSPCFGHPQPGELLRRQYAGHRTIDGEPIKGAAPLAPAPTIQNSLCCRWIGFIC